MKFNSIYDMIQIVEKSDLGRLELDDKVIEYRLNLISNFIINLESEYFEQLEILCNTSVRFCDYYDMGMLHDNDIIQYFNDNYNGRDKDKLIDVFVLYVILKNAESMIYAYDLSDGAEDLYRFLDCGNYFEDILFLIDYLEKKRKVDLGQKQPGFLDSKNKYQILFSGLAFDDIKHLEKDKKKAFIKKISGQLSKDDCVTLTESIDHVKESFDFPIMRVHLANDYRIAYIRKDGITVILGVSIKSGKEKDYNRYDPVAKKKERIYEEIRLFKLGKLPLNSQHYKTVEYLLDFYNRYVSNVNETKKRK